MNKYYYAIIHEEGETFWAEFLSLHNVFTDGKNMEDVIERCKIAANLCMEELKNANKPYPNEVSLKEAQKQVKKNDGVLMIIPVEMPAKTQRIAITIPEDRLAIIDSYVKKHNTNRSAFLVNSAISRIQA